MGSPQHFVKILKTGLKSAFKYTKYRKSVNNYDFLHGNGIEFGRDWEFCTITNYLYIFGVPAGLCLYY
jgi:hypothetical protein